MLRNIMRRIEAHARGKKLIDISMYYCRVYFVGQFASIHFILYNSNILGQQRPRSRDHNRNRPQPSVPPGRWVSLRTDYHHARVCLGYERRDDPNNIMIFWINSRTHIYFGRYAPCWSSNRTLGASRPSSQRPLVSPQYRWLNWHVCHHGFWKRRCLQRWFVHHSCPSPAFLNPLREFVFKCGTRRILWTEMYSKRWFKLPALWCHGCPFGVMS